MATSIKFGAGTFVQETYNAATGVVTKTLSSPANLLRIRNLDGTNNVLISLDGTNFLTIRPGEIFTLECTGLKSYKVKSSAGTPSTECLYGSEA